MTRSPRILVVDDNSLLAENLKELLTEEGYDVDFATSGAEALEHGECFDVYLTDVRMPGMDGWQLSHRLRRRCPDARFIMMSGFAEPGARPHNEREAPLPKPVPLAALLEMLG